MNFNYFDRVALSTFTSLEKQSLYQLLCGAMMIDGNRDSREIAIINEVNQSWELLLLILRHHANCQNLQ